MGNYDIAFFTTDDNDISLILVSRYSLELLFQLYKNKKMKIPAGTSVNLT